MVTATRLVNKVAGQAGRHPEEPRPARDPQRRGPVHPGAWLHLPCDRRRQHPQLSLRGIGGNAIASTSGGAPTTGVYIDDIAMQKRNLNGATSGSGTPVPLLYDLDRIEVLRGPQRHALHGGSSRGGVPSSRQIRADHLFRDCARGRRHHLGRQHGQRGRPGGSASRSSRTSSASASPASIRCGRAGSTPIPNMTATSSPPASTAARTIPARFAAVAGDARQGDPLRPAPDELRPGYVDGAGHPRRRSTSSPRTLANAGRPAA